MSTKPRSTVSDKRPSTKGTAVPLRRSARLIEKRAREAAKENASGGQGPSDPSSREGSTGIPPTDATLAVSAEPQSVASFQTAVSGPSDEGPDPEQSLALVPVSPESSSRTSTVQLATSPGTPVPPVNSGVMVVHQRPADELQASVLDGRDPGLGAIVSTARPETGAATVRLEFTPGTMHPSLRTPLEQSTTPIPDTSTFQPAELVTRNAGRSLATSEMTDADMMAYGAVQLERWAKAPPEVVLPADIVYDRRGQGYDMREFLRAAVATSIYLGLAKEHSPPKWIWVLQAERRRLPVSSDLRAIKTSPKLLSPLTCVALLQTMMWEAGFQFVNRVPVWDSVRELSLIPASEVRSEVETLGHLIGIELTVWSSLIGSTPYSIREPLDPFPSSSPMLEFPVDADGDALMAEDVQTYIGAEVVLRLRMTGVRPRSPASSEEGEPSKKRLFLPAPSLPSVPSNSIPSWPGSTPSEVSRAPGSDSIPSLIGPNSISDVSMAVSDEAMNLSGLSSSGSSLLSTTDYMAGGVGGHMAVITPGAMMMFAQAQAVNTQSPDVSMPVSASRLKITEGSGPNTAMTAPRFDPTRMPLPGTPESGGSSSSDSSYEPSSSDDEEMDESVPGIGVPYPQSGGALGHPGSPTPASHPTNANAVMETSALTQRYEEALARLRAEASAQIQLEREEARRREHVMQTQVEEERARAQAEKEKKRKERAARKELKSRAKQVQAKAIQGQRQGDLLALERIAKERAASEAQKRRADEERAQFLLNMQAQLAATQAQAEEAQTRAVAEEAQRAAAYEAQLREMHQRHEQDQANAKKAYDDQVEKLRQSRMKPQKLVVESSGNMRAPADAQVPQFRAEPMLKTESQPNVKAKPVVKLAEPKSEKPGAGTVAAAQLEAMVKTMQQVLIQAQMAQAGAASASSVAIPVQTGNRSGKAKAKDARPQSKTKHSKPPSKRKPSRSGPSDSDDSDSAPDAPDSSDDSQDESGSVLGDEVAPDEDDEATSGNRTVIQSLIPHNVLERFDEKALLEDRVNWWERFMYYATMAPWSEKTRITQLRGRLSASLRNWCAQLPREERSSWKKLSHRFKKEFCRTVGSPFERYYAARIRDHETPRMFLYRLNTAAIRAGISYLSPSSARELHVRQFLKATRDSKLKNTLQGQRFQSIKELEETLKRVEALQLDDVSDSSAKRNTSGLQFGRYKPVRKPETGKSYVALGEASGSESDRHVHFSDTEEGEGDRAQRPNPVDPVQDDAPRDDVRLATTLGPTISASSWPVSGSQTDEEIYRVAEQMAWRPSSNLNAASGRNGQPQRTKCGRCGGTNHATDNCWSGLICGRCHEEGHPTQYCRRRPCGKCGEFHRRGLCDMWAALKAVQEVLRAGGSIDGLAPEVIQQLLSDPGAEQPLNE